MPALCRCMRLVRRLDLPDAREHLVFEVFWRRLLARALHREREHFADMRLIRAVRTVVDVVADVGRILCLEFVVQVFLEFGLRLLATAVGHFLLPVVGAASKPRPCAYSASRPRRRRRPRWSRLMTVPTGVFMMSAISW